MNIRSTISILCILAAAATATPAFAGDATIGAGVFTNRCKECHEAPAGDRKAGPSLVGVVGRQAGTLEGFNYSDAMRSAGFIWTVEQLSAYLVSPRTVVPGNRMPFNGIKREGEVGDLIAYLQSISPGSQ